MTLDATAAYPNHMGHSVCLRNSMLSPNIAQKFVRPILLERLEHEHSRNAEDSSCDFS
jgi:hypothetical protein